MDEAIDKVEVAIEKAKNPFQVQEKNLRDKKRRDQNLLEKNLREKKGKGKNPVAYNLVESFEECLKQTDTERNCPATGGRKLKDDSDVPL